MKIDLKSCVCVNDFKEAAQQQLSKPIFSYIQSGSEQQMTKTQNEIAFHRLMMIPRVLISTPNVDLKTKLFGRQLNLPFGFSPWALNSLCHPEGQKIPARVANENNIAFTLSTLSTRSLNEIEIQNGEGLRLLQIYVSKSWEQTKATIRLAEKYKFNGLVITVDAQILGIRRKQQQNKLKLQISHIKVPVIEEILIQANSTIQNQSRASWLQKRDLTMNWDTIQRIRSITKLKIILKGIMHPKDAQLATNCCDAIWISNHGGRQLDGISPTIDILAEMKRVVEGKVPIFIDGGIRSGNDIFKCLALGADYVFFARPMAYSLVFGYEGVTKLVKILEDELRRAMILVGCKNIREISAKCIVPEPSL